MIRRHLIINIVILIALLILIFSFVLFAVSNVDENDANLESNNAIKETNNTGYRRDAILEADSTPKEIKVINLYRKKLNENVYIQQKDEIGTDGWFLYEIKNKDKVIIEISYDTISEKKQLVDDVNSDYFVIASQYLFNKKTNELSSLGLYDDCMVNDYDFYSDNIAFITYERDKREFHRLICIKNIKTNNVKVIDKYIIDDPGLTFLKDFYLGYDSKGDLYYDYYDKGIPKIIRYDTRGNKEVFLDKSCNPKISKNDIMASLNLNDYSKDSRHSTTLRLTNLNNNSIIMDNIKDMSRLFWLSNKVLLYNNTSLTYDVYKISSDKLELVDKIKLDFIPFDVIETNNEYEFTGYSFKSNLIELKIFFLHNQMLNFSSKYK